MSNYIIIIRIYPLRYFLRQRHLPLPCNKGRLKRFLQIISKKACILSVFLIYIFFLILLCPAVIDRLRHIGVAL